MLALPSQLHAMNVGMEANENAFVIYHNPRCGKSRTALALLRERGIEPRIVEYLQDPLTRDELRTLIKKLGIEPEALVRKGENLYKERYRDQILSGEQWLATLSENPILIERPVVMRGSRGYSAARRKRS